MAIQRFGSVLPISTVPVNTVDNGSFTLNAAADHCQAIGSVFIPGGGTKTISAAGGGSIFCAANAATWATASSTLSVGIEDVDANGFGDGTQDVLGIKVAGTNPITANSNMNFPMTTGTKTLTDGDNIAITMRLTIRAGADSVGIQSTDITQQQSILSGRPYGINGAAGGAGSKTNSIPFAMIKFDDGTFGFILGTYLVHTMASTAIAFNSGSTPDEYIAAFTVLNPVEIAGGGWVLDGTAAGENFEYVLYSDPFGTPTIIETIAVTIAARAITGSSAVSITEKLATFRTLMPGTVYGLALRPTTAGTFTTYFLDLTTGFADLKTMIPFFNNVKLAARTNQTGPFVETQIYHVPIMMLYLIGFDDGASAGGGAFAYAFPG